MNTKYLHGLLLIACTLIAAAAPRTSPAKGSVDIPDLYRRSYAAEAEQDYTEALRLMEKIRATGAKDYFTVLRTAWLLYLNGKNDESAGQYRKAIRMKPAAVEPRLGVMLPLMAARRWKEALDQGFAVLKKAPANFTAQSRIAYIHYQQGQYKKAETWYRKALSNFPSNLEMQAGLGWSLLKQHRFKEARTEFQKVLAVAPDHASSKTGLSQIP